MNNRIEEGHMDPLEEGAVHQVMPQGTIEHGAQTSEEAQLATDRPQRNDRCKVHMRLGDFIPGTGVMRVKEETIPAIRTGGTIQRRYQGAMILRRGIQEMLHQWRYVLPGECYIDVFMTLLGLFFFNIMTGRTVNEHSAPSGCSKQRANQRGRRVVWNAKAFQILVISFLTQLRPKIHELGRVGDSRSRHFLSGT